MRRIDPLVCLLFYTLLVPIMSRIKAERMNKACTLAHRPPVLTLYMSPEFFGFRPWTLASGDHPPLPPFPGSFLERLRSQPGVSAETGDPRLLSATRILGSGLVAVDQNQPVSVEVRRFTLLTHLSIGFGASCHPASTLAEGDCRGNNCDMKATTILAFLFLISAAA
jgi:hypothetical protein